MKNYTDEDDLYYLELDEIIEKLTKKTLIEAILEIDPYGRCGDTLDVKENQKKSYEEILKDMKRPRLEKELYDKFYYLYDTKEELRDYLIEKYLY